ncbi:hypothetical protein ACFLTI_08145, partial [Bacteroidota bacterium]
MKKKKWIPIAILLFILVLFAGYKIRMHFCIEKNKIEMRETNLSDEIIVEISEKIDNKLLSISALAEELRESRMLLFGEPHLQVEVMNYFTEILDHLQDEQIVLNVELPPSLQENIDHYMESGEERFLDSMAECKSCLPLQEIFRWCYKNRNRVIRIFAVDEELDRILFKRRCLCMDTRNRTMSGQVYKTYQDYPDARIIFYGGQLHVMKSGRYKYDIPNRVSAGTRLINSDIPDKDIKVIMISGEDDIPLSKAWKGIKGALDVRGIFYEIPITYFYTFPLYRLSYAGDMFDFYVNVGKTT